MFHVSKCFPKISQILSIGEHESLTCTAGFVNCGMFYANPRHIFIHIRRCWNLLDNMKCSVKMLEKLCEFDERFKKCEIFCDVFPKVARLSKIQFSQCFFHLLCKHESVTGAAWFGVDELWKDV